MIITQDDTLINNKVASYLATYSNYQSKAVASLTGFIKLDHEVAKDV